MLCGPPNIWPQPSIRTVLGSKVLKFSSGSFKLNIDTRFDNVKNLLQHAYEIFREEVKHLETTEHSLRSNHHVDEKDNIRKNNDENQHHKTVTHDSNDVQDIATNDISDSFVPLLATFSEQPYDVNNFAINIRVYAHSDTYLSLSTDESYNLTLTRKLLENNLAAIA